MYIFNDLEVAKKPPNVNSKVNTVTVGTDRCQPTCIRVLVCINNQTDDESFNLWDTFNLTFALFVTINCNIVIS